MRICRRPCTFGQHQFRLVFVSGHYYYYYYYYPPAHVGLRSAERLRLRVRVNKLQRQLLQGRRPRRDRGSHGHLGRQRRCNHPLRRGGSRRNRDTSTSASSHRRRAQSTGRPAYSGASLSSRSTSVALDDTGLTRGDGDSGLVCPGMRLAKLLSYRTILSEPSGQGRMSGISTMRPLQKLNIGERSGEADADVARRAIAKARTAARRSPTASRFSSLLTWIPGEHHRPTHTPPLGVLSVRRGASRNRTGRFVSVRTGAGSAACGGS